MEIVKLEAEIQIQKQNQSVTPIAGSLKKMNNYKVDQIN